MRKLFKLLYPWTLLPPNKKGWHITYWTARGGHSKRNLYQFTKDQLTEWGCKFDDLVVGYSNVWGDRVKPSVDLIIDDKSKRIEEL